jgi:hypothetical protein
LVSFLLLFRCLGYLPVVARKQVHLSTDSQIRKCTFAALIFVCVSNSRLHPWGRIRLAQRATQFQQCAMQAQPRRASAPPGSRRTVALAHAAKQRADMGGADVFALKAHLISANRRLSPCSPHFTDGRSFGGRLSVSSFDAHLRCPSNRANGHEDFGIRLFPSLGNPLQSFQQRQNIHPWRLYLYSFLQNL